MYGHGHGSYLEEIMLMKCLITSVCLLVDLADLCTVSHANFVFAMMQYLDWRHRSGAWVSWLKYLLLWENDRIELRWKAENEEVPRNCIWCWCWLGQWTWYQPDKCQTAAVPLGITRYHSVSVSRTPSEWNKTFIRPQFYPAETLGPGHIRLMAPSIVLSPAAAASAQNAAESV